MKVLFPDPFSSPDFSDDEITEAVHLLTHGDVSDDSKGNFLSALHHRGETASELAGFARAILKESIKVRIEHRPAEPLLELCGTGGDRAGYLNISTAAMFVAAGAGARVVKHGNRAVSSRCGSADVLESLGVSLHLRPDSVGRILENAGSVFLLASDFHPSISVIAPLRRVLARNGQMTIFNLLGPLLNPALPEFQLTGIFKPELLDFYAQALGMMGRRKAWAVHGKGLDDSEGVDELSITGPSRVFSSSREGEGESVVTEFVIDPLELGFSRVELPNQLLGGDELENARRIVAILSGQEIGAARDMIVLNAAAALHLAGFGGSLEEAITIANESIDSGKALTALDLLRVHSKAGAA